MHEELTLYRKLVREEWTNGDTVSAWARWHTKITAQQVNMREALIQQARIHDWQGEPREATRTMEEALPLARELGDKKLLVFALRASGNARMNLGEGNPETHFQESIDLQ